MVSLENIYAHADHPQTTINPDWCFKIHECKIEAGKLYVRGMKTCWFESKMCNFYNEREGLELLREWNEIQNYRKKSS